MKKLFLISLCCILAVLMIACKPKHTDDNEREEIEKKGKELITKFLDENIDKYEIVHCAMHYEVGLGDNTTIDDLPTRVVYADFKSLQNDYKVFVDTATGKLYTDYYYKKLKKEYAELEKQQFEKARLCINDTLEKYIKPDSYVVENINYTEEPDYFVIESKDLYDPTLKKKIDTYATIYWVWPAEINSAEKMNDYYSNFSVKKIYIAYSDKVDEALMEKLFTELKASDFKCDLELVNVSEEELDDLKKGISYGNTPREMYTYDSESGTYSYAPVD